MQIPPVVEMLSVTDAMPKQMKNAGGTALTLTGTGFQTGATVTIAGVPAQDVVVVSSTTIQCKSPLKAATCGQVPIVVTNPDGKTANRADLIAFLSNGLQYSVPTAVTMGTFPRQVVAVDLNKDGKVDLVSANSGNANQAVIFRLGSGDGTFTAANAFTAGSSAFGVVVGDFNKDGNLDLAAVNSASNDISVRLATGVAQYGASTTYTSGADPRAIVTGDLNGDGALDLVTVSFASSNINVYLNKNDGSGNFQPAASSAVGTSPVHLALADVNKDGKLDVITANSNGNNLTLRLGAGNGTFGTGMALSAGSSPVFVATADWNGDGKLDIAAVNNGITTGTYVVSILAGDGAGAFGAATNIDIGNMTVPRGAVVGDFNLDGKPDLAVAGYGNNTLPVLLGKGDGTFEPVVSLTGPANPHSLDTADFNGDGFPDLVATTSITGSQNVSVLLGQCK